jgi:uncharacterized membrane protein
LETSEVWSTISELKGESIMETTTVLPRQRQTPALRSFIPTTGRVNVGEVERWASVLAGGCLGVFGLNRGTLGGLALAGLGGYLMYRGLTGHCSAYQALDLNTADHRGTAGALGPQGLVVEKTITINRRPEELYQFWRHLENLPRFMAHLESVQETGPQRSHWVAKAPLGQSVQWDAEIVDELPNERIQWRSLEGADVDSAGWVSFRRAPEDRGTEVEVMLQYHPPAGRLGAVIARLFGEHPEQQLRDDLHRFKQMMEAGEVATTQGQPTYCG